MIKIKSNTFAIPFRTNVKHNNCYKFTSSNRNTSSQTGIDFTKAVIVNNKLYIGAPARIDDKEYNNLDANFYTLEKKLKNTLMATSNILNLQKIHMQVLNINILLLNIFTKN